MAQQNNFALAKSKTRVMRLNEQCNPNRLIQDGKKKHAGHLNNKPEKSAT